MANNSQDDGRWTEIHLIGAPDETIGSSSAERKIAQAFQVELSPADVEELRYCSRIGQRITLLCGKDPALRYGENSKRLLFSSLPGRQELYQTISDETATSSSADFVGLISHHVTVAEPVDAMASARGVQIIQAGYAKDQKQKDENQMRHISEVSLDVNKPRRKKVTVFGSMTGNHHTKPRSHVYPTTQSSLPLPDEPIEHILDRNQQQRYSLVHYLAVHEASLEDIIKHTNIPKLDCEKILSKVGTEVDSKWRLDDKHFKELTPWEFPYESGDRQAAIANAVNALDRKRVERNARVWELLNPPGQRGKGNHLSRLLDLRAGPRAARPTQAHSYSSQQTPPPFSRSPLNDHCLSPYQSANETPSLTRSLKAEDDERGEVRARISPKANEKISSVRPPRSHSHSSEIQHHSSQSQSTDEMPATTRSAKAKGEPKPDEAKAQPKKSVKKTSAKPTSARKTKSNTASHVKDDGKGSKGNKQTPQESAAKSKTNNVERKHKSITSAPIMDNAAGKKRTLGETDVLAVTPQLLHSGLRAVREAENSSKKPKFTPRTVPNKSDFDEEDNSYAQHHKTTPSSDSSILSEAPRSPLTPPSLHQSPPKDHIHTQTNGNVDVTLSPSKALSSRKTTEASNEALSSRKITEAQQERADDVEQISVTAKQIAPLPPPADCILPRPAIPYTTTNPAILAVFKEYQRTYTEYVVARCAAEMALEVTGDCAENDEIQLNAAEKFDEHTAMTEKMKVADPKFGPRRAYDAAGLRDALSKDAKMWMKLKLRQYREEVNALFKETKAKDEAGTAMKEEKLNVWGKWFDMDHFRAMVNDMFLFESVNKA